MSLWSQLTAPALADDGTPVKSRAAKLDDQLGRIESELLRLQSGLALCERRLAKLDPDTTDDARNETRSVVEIVQKDDAASRMMQYMTALSILEHAGGGRIAGAQLPEWGIEPVTIAGGGKQVVRDSGQWVPVQRLARMLRECLIDRVVLEGDCQSLENFLPPGAYRDFFQAHPHAGRTVGADCLLIDVCNAALPDPPHGDRVLLPVAFYADVIQETGLKPVFLGEWTASPYMDALRRRFPDASYLDSMGATADFATIMKASHIVVGASASSWLAAWLSGAAQIILPLNGLLNPFQCPATDLLPKNDPRYRFYIFPINYAVPAGQTQPVHDAITGRWRSVTSGEITQWRSHYPKEQRKILDYLAVFDDDYYERVNHDVREGVAAGWLSSGRGHFAGAGFAENRRAFDLDARFYSVAYPEAADALSRGIFVDFWHYHASVGHEAGNRLRADAQVQ